MKKCSKKCIIGSVAIIVVALVVLGAGLYFYHKEQDTHSLNINTENGLRIEVR